jgi:hypothetical protein
VRGPPAAYFLIAALALLPTAALRHAGLPATNSSYPFVTFALALLAALLLVRPLVLVAKRHDAPLKQLKDDLRDNWPWLATAAFLAVALPQTLDAATVIKRQIPQIMPYYADPALIRLEAALGFEPWQVTHAIFGPLTRVIDIFYAGWHFVHIAFGVWIIVAAIPGFNFAPPLPGNCPVFGRAGVRGRLLR